MNKTIDIIKNQIKENPVILYMKGTPNNPQCGFSSKAAKILSIYSTSFAYIDVLTHTEIRSALPKFSNWPTFPQLWIKGELIGGTDIIVDLHYNSKLKLLINSANSCKTNNK